MPLSEGLGALKELLLPAYPDLKAIRELSVSPYLRSQFKVSTPSVASIDGRAMLELCACFVFAVQCEEAGLVRLSVFTLSNGFEQHGVQLADHGRILL